MVLYRVINKGNGYRHDAMNKEQEAFRLRRNCVNDLRRIQREQPGYWMSLKPKKVPIRITTDGSPFSNVIKAAAHQMALNRRRLIKRRNKTTIHKQIKKVGYELSKLLASLAA